MSSPALLAVDQKPTMPNHVRPIVSIGAGGIVRDAHLPAYRLANFPVVSLFDRNIDRAKEIAREFGIAHVPATLDEAISKAPENAVFDLALPAAANLETIAQLPDGAAVLIQKPLGENLEQARSIVALCHSKNLKAGVNFQLRYAPCIAAARSLIDQGAIGDLHDMEVRVTVYMPWQLWSFLEEIPRVEILYHSVHYIDLIRSFLGEPSGVWAKTAKHPKTQNLASTRTNIILNYGDTLRANITTNHGHEFGAAHQESYVKWEGTHGAIKARLGLLMNYPKGEPDTLEYCQIEDEKPSPWKNLALEGNWYPHAFIGTMASIIRFANGETDCFPTSVDDAFLTMATVEAAYESSDSGGTPIPPL
jgi:predicted dehydrogenase